MSVLDRREHVVPVRVVDGLDASDHALLEELEREAVGIRDGSERRRLIAGRGEAAGVVDAWRARGPGDGAVVDEHGDDRSGRDGRGHALRGADQQGGGPDAGGGRRGEHDLWAVRVAGDLERVARGDRLRERGHGQGRDGAGARGDARRLRADRLDLAEELRMPGCGRSTWSRSLLRPA